jgi:multidrug efflux pump subunit AcrA (membrane-fusion protein)
LKKTIAVILLAVVALALMVFRKRADAPTIAFAKVTRETIASTLSTNGKVEPIEYVDVRARPRAW